MGRRAVGVDRGATQALAAVDAVDEVLELAAPADLARQRRAGKLQREADRRQALRGRQVGAHHAAHRDIGHQAHGGDVDAATLVLAVGAAVHRHLDFARRGARKAHPQQVA
jgi:hypothetical protein